MTEQKRNNLFSKDPFQDLYTPKNKSTWLQKVKAAFTRFVPIAKQGVVVGKEHAVKLSQQIKASSIAVRDHVKEKGIKTTVTDGIQTIKLLSKQQKRRIIVGCLALIVAWGSWTYLLPKSTSAKQVFTKVAEKPLTNSLSLTGEVASAAQKSLTFGGNKGVITNVSVALGDKVKRGEILAEVDPRELEAKLLQADSAYKIAQVNRIKKEKGQDIQVQQQSLDKPELAVRDAENNLNTQILSSEATIKQMEADIKTKQIALANSQESLQNTERDIGEDLILSQMQVESAENDYEIAVDNKTSTGTTRKKAELSYDMTVEQSVKTKLSSDTKINATKYSLLNDQMTYNNILTTFSTTKAQQESGIIKSQNALESAKNALETEQTNLNDLLASHPLDLETLKAQEAQSKAARDLAEIALENATIKAPFNGTITKVLFKQNDTYESGEVLQITDFNQLIINVSVSERDIVALMVGQPAKITFDAYAGKSFEGEVTIVDPSPVKTQGVVNYVVTVSLPYDQRIKLGMTSNVEIITASTEPTFVVSSRSVTTHATSGISTIKIRRNGSIVDQVVEVGISNGTEVQITSGLQSGDEVVSTSTR